MALMTTTWKLRYAPGLLLNAASGLSLITAVPSPLLCPPHCCALPTAAHHPDLASVTCLPSLSSRSVHLPVK